MITDITGMMVYYDIVCRRKLWYFMREIRMENQNENVALGKLLDQSSYSRDEKHLNIDNVINIDRITPDGVLHEVKKSRKIEDAAVWQMKYYLYYLKERGVSPLKGQLDFPLLKQTLNVELSPADETALCQIFEEIRQTADLEFPPELVKLPICKNCAYYDLCFI